MIISIDINDDYNVNGNEGSNDENNYGNDNDNR